METKYFKTRQCTGIQIKIAFQNKTFMVVLQNLSGFPENQALWAQNLLSPYLDFIWVKDVKDGLMLESGYWIASYQESVQQKHQQEQQEVDPLSDDDSAGEAGGVSRFGLLAPAAAEALVRLLRRPSGSATDDGPWDEEKLLICEGDIHGTFLSGSNIVYNVNRLLFYYHPHSHMNILWIITAVLI